MSEEELEARKVQQREQLKRVAEQMVAEKNRLMQEVEQKANQFGEEFHATLDEFAEVVPQAKEPIQGFKRQNETTQSYEKAKLHANDTNKIAKFENKGIN